MTDATDTDAIGKGGTLRRQHSPIYSGASDRSTLTDVVGIPPATELVGRV